MTTALGWTGTALVLAAYLQPNLIRLRTLSLLASAILISFNVLIEVWSNVALEIALVAINLGRMRHATRSTTAALGSGVASTEQSEHPASAHPALRSLTSRRLIRRHG